MPVPRRSLVLLATLLVAACAGEIAAPPSLQNGDAAAAARLPGQSLGVATLSASDVALSWVDDSRNEAGWEVHRSNVAAGPYALVATLSVNATSYTNSALSPLTQYCYEVRSYRTLGKNKTYGEFSNAACTTTFGPPAAPTALNATPRGSTDIALAWTDNATNETAYRVERSPDGVTWTAYVTLEPNANSFLAFTATETRQCYRVIAVGSYGESASNVDCTTAPASPGDLKAVGAVGPSIELSWTDLSSVEEGYEVQRAGTDGVFSVIATLSANATGYHDAGVTADVDYYYQVRAASDGGFSNYAGAVHAVAASGPPRAPTADAFPGGSSSVWVQLTNESPSTTVVRVERSADGATGWVTAGSTDAFVGFIDLNREPEVSMCYRAFASNSVGESGPSNVDCSMPLKAPTNLAATVDEYGNNLTTWTDNSAYETEYYVATLYCESYYECYETAYSIEANSESIITGPFESVTYVYACGDGGCSDALTWGGGATDALRASSSSQRSRAPALSPQARMDRIREMMRSARKKP
ncbi:MAG TPA: fibronectin type III domain-containing protein [Gemmatimonadaceae bacterium]|nr:fibronectin type III domain-containing protein [Gemmatimonadaceae bacterium]